MRADPAGFCTHDCLVFLRLADLRQFPNSRGMAESGVSAARAEPGPGAKGGISLWSSEAWGTLALAGPLILTNLAQISFRTTDTVMMGRLGAAELAGGALGINFYFPLYLFGLGVAMAVAPMAAQALGARQYKAARRSVRQGLWVVTAIGLLCGLLIWNAAPFLRAFGQAEANVTLAEAYLRAAVWGIVPSFWLLVLRSFAIALTRPRPVLVIAIVGAGLHVLIEYALMFGHFGLPALGVVGAGVSNSLVQWFMFLAMVGYILYDRRYRRFALLVRLWRPDWPRFFEVLRVGLPIGFTILAESGLFATAVYLMGALGTAQLAAHAIALQCIALAFMVPLGIAQAATVRVGRAQGAGDSAAVGRAGWVAIALGAAISLVPAAVFWFLPRLLIELFLDPLAPGSLPVIAFAVTFLAIGAVFQLFDGIQVVAANALRGLKDTRVPMWIAIFSYWPVGLGAALLLGFSLGGGGEGIWLGLALGLVVAAVLLVWRFHRRERFAPIPAAP